MLLLGADDKLIRPSVVNDPENLASYTKGFRAYFQLKGDAASARAISVVFNDATAIRTIDNGQWTMDNSDGTVYDLSGRKMVHGTSSNGTLRKGVYIVNGKKLIIK